jgi:tetratricopeptide (TPR) repeat protein
VLVADRVFQGHWPEKEQKGYCYPVVLLFAGLLWGLHPLRVESVAWVSERKDVLNGLFFLGSLLFYLQFALNCTKRSDNIWLNRDYLLSFVLFVLSLMAKPISVILPFMLLVIDWYPLCRLHKSQLRTIVVEKVPFLICSMAMMAATLLIARQSNILASYDNLSVLQRLAVSGNALFEYCRFMLYPAGILPLHVIDTLQMTAYALKGMAIVILVAVGVYVFRKYRWPVAVLLCFLLPLLPVLALFQNGIQSFASRFAYIPSLTPSIVIAFLAGSVFQKDDSKWQRFSRKAVLIAGIALVVAYGMTSWRFIGIWESTETVWSRIIDIQPTGRAFKERGIYYLTRGQDVAAEKDLTASIPYAQRAGMEEIFKLYALRGVALFNQERYTDAAVDFSQAISLCPDPSYFYYRGRAFVAMGKIKEAEADFKSSGSANGPIEWGNSVCR